MLLLFLQSGLFISFLSPDPVKGGSSSLLFFLMQAAILSRTSYTGNSEETTVLWGDLEVASE